MHRFDTLINRGTSFTLNALEEVNSKVVEPLRTTGSTSAVKNLQMIQLQKTILVIGMFSLFESILQQRLSCKNGFKKAKEVLEQSGKFELLNSFNDFFWAINVLKHGKGPSYDKLISKADSLPFKIKQENEDFFNEGNVGEVSTYIKVDNDFVLKCADLVQEVSNAIRKSYPTSNL